MKLEAIITSYEKPDALQFTKQLFSAPVPEAGIEIPTISELGAILSYVVGAQASFQGSATIDTGLSMTAPDTASVDIDAFIPELAHAPVFRAT